MKLYMKLLWIMVGCVLASILSELSPVFTLGFWRLAASSDCFIMDQYNGTKGEKLLSRIVCSQTPEISLRLLYNIGSNQAQVYAIHGLGVIGSQYNQKYIAEFSNAQGKVNMRCGSTWTLFSKKELAELLKNQKKP